VFKNATEADPSYVPAHGHLGLAYYKMRNYEDAIIAYKRAFELGDTTLEYYYETGLSYAFLDRCAEARPWCLQAIDIDNTAWPAWDCLDLCPEEAEE
jgi:tetratricopeptide (TPR) repeat protein